VAYQEIFETSKLYMRGVTVIDPAWLPTFCESQCNFSQPLPDPEPRYDATRVISE
jgi:ATP-dependent RNA helicase DHX37/DHR1